MKKQFTFLILMLVANLTFGHSGSNYEASDFFKNMKAGDRAAIVVVHFGTTHSDTREKTIDELNAKVKNTFPDVDVFEAYTSRIVIKRLKDNGVNKEHPGEVLKRLSDEGYTHILVQPSTIINGVEMESLNKNIDEVENLFTEVRVGNPLLYTPDDYEKVIETLTAGNSSDTAYVWVGHGTYDPTTAQYAMLDYMLKSKGHDNCFVGTIEGYPEYDDMLAQLQKSGLKNVRLVPFMFVAGEHAKNDIANDWKEELEKEGFNVEVEMRGLGENPQIQDIYIAHLDFMAHHRKIGIMKKKKIYEKTGEKM